MDIRRQQSKDPKRFVLPPLEDVESIGTSTLEMPMERVPSRAEWDVQQNVVNNAPIPQRPELQGQQGLGQRLPPLEDENYGVPPTELSVQQNRYTDAVRSRPNKQGNLAQAAWWALQGVNKIFNPQDDTPVQWLGEAKRERRIANEAAKLAPLQAQEQFKQQQVGLQQKRQMDALEYQLKMSKGMQDAFNNDPDILLIKESKRVTPDQAQRLNGKYGTNYTPAFWGSFVEKEVGGQSYIRPSDRPNYAANTSIATDVTETPVQVPLSGGGMGAVPSKQAVALDGAERVAGITANRQIATTNANIADGVQQRNTKAINDYNNSVVQFGNTIAQKLAELGDATGSSDAAYLAKQVEEANLAYTQSADEDEAAARLKVVNGLSAKLASLYDKQTKNQAVQAALKGMKPPVKPKLEKAVQVDMSSTGKPFTQPQNTPKTASMSDVKDYAKLAKVSLATAKKYFTDAGFSVQ